MPLKPIEGCWWGMLGRSWTKGSSTLTAGHRVCRAASGLRTLSSSACCTYLWTWSLSAFGRPVCSWRVSARCKHVMWPLASGSSTYCCAMAWHGRQACASPVPRFYFLWLFGELALKVSNFKRAWKIARGVGSRQARPMIQDTGSIWMPPSLQFQTPDAEKRSICVLCCTIFHWPPGFKAPRGWITLLYNIYRTATQDMKGPSYMIQFG